MLKIERLWFEVELWLDTDYINFIRSHGIIENVFTKQNILWEKVNWRIVKEYYSNQIEINLPLAKKRTAYSMLKKISKAMITNDNWKRKFQIEMKWPEYVGTHCHIEFNINHKPLTNKKLPVLVMTLEEMYKSFLKIYKEQWPSVNLFYAVYRIIRNHNIWIYMDHNILWSIIRSNLNDIWKDFIYSNWIDKKKYQPVFRSEQISWVKWRTLELRVLSNYIAIYSPDTIINIINKVEKIVNDENQSSIKNKNYKLLIKKIHKSFISLLFDIWISFTKISKAKIEEHCKTIESDGKLPNQKEIKQYCLPVFQKMMVWILPTKNEVSKWYDIIRNVLHPNWSFFLLKEKDLILNYGRDIKITWMLNDKAINALHNLTKDALMSSEVKTKWGLKMLHIMWSVEDPTFFIEYLKGLLSTHRQIWEWNLSEQCRPFLNAYNQWLFVSISDRSQNLKTEETKKIKEINDDLYKIKECLSQLHW